MKTLFRRLIADDRGATAIEYGLIIALIFLVILASVQLFASTSTGTFNRAMTAISDAIG